MGDIVSESGSPKGSLYFHFPGGKEELAALALTDAGNATCEAIRSALFGGKTTKAGVEQVFGMIMAELEQSGYRAGCPVGTVAAEAPEAPRVLEAVEGIFESWQAVIKDRLMQGGLRARRADELAEFILALFEGSVVLAKAKKTTLPLKSALREISRQLSLEQVR
jgi:TetR/AcrR family transcriptional regulator, lmrAB and yxaGH operons repressor